MTIQIQRSSIHFAEVIRVQPGIFGKVHPAPVLNDYFVEFIQKLPELVIVREINRHRITVDRKRQESPGFCQRFYRCHSRPQLGSSYQFQQLLDDIICTVLWNRDLIFNESLFSLTSSKLVMIISDLLFIFSI